jgi:hypothetical protein
MLLRNSLVCVGLLLLLSANAHARPDYARKEGRNCQYCHESASPNSVNRQSGQREPTTRNKRGLYYAAHNYSFTGYTETAPAAMPSFKYLWKAEFTDMPRRIAVADVTGDGEPRLILLHEKSSTSATLTVRKWDGKEFVTEFTGETQGPANTMQVGRFSGPNRPAVIVTTDALWSWNGKTFFRTPAPQPLSLFGSVRLKTGQELLLLADSPQNLRAHRVILTGAAKWLDEGREPPDPGQNQIQWEGMHATPDFFNKIGMPPLLGEGGLLGMWSIPKGAREKDTFALYHTKFDQDLDVKPDPKNPNKPQITLKSEYYSIALLNMMSQTTAPFWTTPRLETRPLDVAVENPRGDKKPGLLVLTAEPKGSKTRTLYFFGLE